MSHDHLRPSLSNTASWVYNIGVHLMVSHDHLNDKDSKSVHGLTDHRPSAPNTASWLYNVGSP